MEYSSSPDRITRDFFDSLLLETRYVDSATPDTGMDLFGEHFATPIMTAALSHLGSGGRKSADFIGHSAVNGMIVYAEAAAKSKAVHWIGMGSDEELKEIVATGARCIKIVKPLEDNDEVIRELKYAADLGCMAVGMDIDHSFDAKGSYDNVFGIPMKAKSFDELKDFVQASEVPFIAKGILSPKDAEKCAKAGCAGIVVSHHHGMMPYSVPPLMVLEDIVGVSGKDMQVFVDCGIESGMDAYKCLALGAKAVSVGRHLMPLLKEGASAVSDRIDGMTSELAGVMARTGVRNLNEMDASVIHRRAF